MNVFDTLFPRRTRTATRSPRNRAPAFTNGRQRTGACGEQLESRLALAVVTPFAPRFTANVQGDITFAANTIMTAVAGLPGTAAQVADAQNGTNFTGTAPGVWNDDFWSMRFVDIDSDAGTFSSSSAMLGIPAGAEVLFAGLYWGGRVLGTTQLNAADNVKLRGPADSGYQDLTATVFSSTPQGAPATGARTYQGFKDVTSLVQAQGEGNYTVANVQANQGNNYSAGWSLVVAYRDNADIPRNLTVFDGFAYVTTGDDDVTIPFSGFRAPLSGPVNATLGLIAYEGDLGITGDSAYFDGGLGEAVLENATNPADNFFNSSISNRGVTVTAKTPNYKNQLGFGADLIEADGLIANNATSATLRLTTTQDFYYPGVITSAIEVYAPEITVLKAAEDLNGGLVEPGDVLRYTITVSNEAAAYDTAKDVVLNDAIPAFTTYKPGSLVITSGANVGAQTDAADSDQAEFIASGNGAVRFRLGTGATGATVPMPAGGTLAAGQSTTVTFDVTVGTFPSSAVIQNSAAVAYNGTFFGPFTRTSQTDTQCPPVADLAITKVVHPSSGTYVPGAPLTYSIIVSNNGPGAVFGTTATDVLPAGTTWVSGGALSGDTVTFTVGALVPGASQSFLLTILPAADRTGELQNEASVNVPDGWFDPNLANNISTNTTAATPQVDLVVAKTRTSALPVIAGGAVTYTITVTSAGPSSITSFLGTDFSVPELLSPFFSVDTGAYDPLTGIWTADPGDSFIAGEVVTFTLTGTVPADATGTLVNTATATPPIFDPNQENNTSTTTDTIVVKPVLSVTKTDGSDTYIPGTAVVYTIVVTNSGPSFLTGGTVADSLPAMASSGSWTATTSANVPGLPVNSVSPASSPLGNNDIDAIVNLAPGSFATFTYTVQTKPDAAGDLVNTVTVTPPPGTQGNTASATDTNTESSPRVTLAVTKDDGKTNYLPNQTFTYTIIASNSGPSALTNGTINDPLPSQVASAFWTATYSLGSSGPSAGLGGINNEKISLLPAGTATFLLTVTIKSDAFGQMDNTVTVAPPAGTSGNTATATDTNFGPEPPLSVTGALVLGSDDGCNGPPWVRVIDPEDGTELSRFLAYAPSFRGSVRVATGDINDDGVAEIITAPGRNAIGEVRVFEQVLGGWAELPQYRTLAFGPQYRGGVEVAVADMDGDGDNDIVTGMSIQSGMVNVFRVTPGASDPVANAPFRSFRGAPAGYNNGVMITAGQYIPGGPAEIAVGTNAGTRALVRVFDVTGAPTVVRSFKPFANSFRGGVTLSTGDYDGNGNLDLIVGAGINGGSRVEVWTPATSTRIAQIQAFSSFARPNARVFAVLGDTAEGFQGDPALYGVQGLNGSRGSRGVRKFNTVTSQTSTLPQSTTNAPPLRIAPIALRFG